MLLLLLLLLLAAAACVLRYMLGVAASSAGRGTVGVIMRHLHCPSTGRPANCSGGR